MPLNPVYLPKVDGLQTETSNINSDPRSLADCIDAVSNREDFIESRHGHPVCKLVNEGRISSFNDHTALGMYAFRNETQKVYVSIYKQTSGFRFLWISQTAEEISPSSNVTSANITAYQITRSAQVNTNPIAFSHDQRLFFMTDNGLFYTKNTYQLNPIVSPVKFPLIRTASIYPEWRPSSSYPSPLDAENAHWLVPGYQVNIKIIFEVEAKYTEDGERRLESPTSRIYEIRKINPQNTETLKRTSNMLVTISDLTVSSIPPSYRVVLKIYRTKQFKIGEDAITEYHLAHPEIVISNTTIVNPLDPNTFIRLTANDDFISLLEPLYNDTSQGGFGVTNHLPLPSKHVTPFRNYHIYSNISLPALTTIGLTQLPDDGDTLSVKLSRTDTLNDRSANITFTNSLTPSLGAVTIPSNSQNPDSPYLWTERDLSFRGIRPGLTDTVSDLNVRLRIIPGSNQGQVEPYGKITKLESIQGATGSLNVATIRVYPDTSGFDAAKFISPGFAVIVTPTGRVVTFFKYDSIVNNITTTNYVDFTSAVTEAAIAPATITSTLYVYYIPGEQIKALPIYIGNSLSYLSFLPCKNQIKEYIASPQITETVAYRYIALSDSLANVAYTTTATTVTLNFSTNHTLVNGESYIIATGIAAVDGTFTITVTSPTQVTYVKAGAASSGVLLGGSATSVLQDLVINPFYVGLLNKPFSILLKDLAIGICDEFQRQFNSTSEDISFSSGGLDEPGVIVVESLNPDYEIISAKTSIGAKSCYEPPLTSNYTVLAKAEKASNAFIVGKLNRPEVVPVGSPALFDVSGPYSPARIGSPNKAIVACAATKDSVYMLKEDGIARVFLGFNTTIPIIDSITFFDATVFCNASGSVQTIRDSVIFLAQDGVYAVEGNSTTKLSRQIETELKKAISQCKNNLYLENIRSFVNPAKNLYGVCIPLTSTTYVTYVLNVGTMRWVKWSNQFNGAVVDLEGRLTTLCTSYEQSLYANYIRQDTYTNSDPRNELDQFDENYLLYSTSSNDSGLERTLSRPAGFTEGLGDIFYRMRYFDYNSNQFKTKQVYYYDGTTYYKLASVQRINSSDLKLVFTTTPPIFSTSHRLIVGVNMMLEFQPFTNNNPSTLKMFSGFHVHTEESVLDLSVSFRTEARSTFSVVKTFSTSPDNRTVYRCYVPLEATRGRFLYRKLTHVRPYQICAIPAQTIVFRETGSERVQKLQ